MMGESGSTWILGYDDFIYSAGLLKIEKRIAFLNIYKCSYLDKLQPDLSLPPIHITPASETGVLVSPILKQLKRQVSTKVLFQTKEFNWVHGAAACLEAGWPVKSFGFFSCSVYSLKQMKLLSFVSLLQRRKVVTGILLMQRLFTCHPLTQGMKNADSGVVVSSCVSAI